jgi:hypothetical protein
MEDRPHVCPRRKAEQEPSTPGRERGARSWSILKNTVAAFFGESFVESEGKAMNRLAFVGCISDENALDCPNFYKF